MSENRRTLHFSVQGEFITNLAREKLYQENDIKYAIDLLMSCTKSDGQSEAEQFMRCIEILNGTKQIVGLYPSDSYGIDDDEPTEKTPGILAWLDRLKQQLDDAKRENRDLSLMLGFANEFLPERTKISMNQAWGRMAHEIETPLKIFEDVPGYVQESRRPDPKDPWSDVSKLTADKVAAMGEKMLEDRLLAERRNKGDDYGWLSPSGAFHPVEWGDHQKWAYNYIVEHHALFGALLEDVKSKALDLWHDGKVVDLLESKGWALIHSPHSGIGRVSPHIIPTLTKKQREFLYGYYVDRDMNDLANEFISD